MDLFRQRATARFVETMTANLRCHYPKATESLNDSALVKLIEVTIEKLQRLGIERECDVERYLYLMFCFSQDIDTQHRFRWVQEILFDESLAGDLRIDLLYQVAERHLEVRDDRSSEA